MWVMSDYMLLCYDSSTAQWESSYVIDFLQMASWRADGTLPLLFLHGSFRSPLPVTTKISRVQDIITFPGVGEFGPTTNVETDCNPTNNETPYHCVESGEKTVCRASVLETNTHRVIWEPVAPPRLAPPPAVPARVSVFGLVWASIVSEKSPTSQVQTWEENTRSERDKRGEEEEQIKESKRDREWEWDRECAQYI